MTARNSTARLSAPAADMYGPGEARANILPFPTIAAPPGNLIRSRPLSVDGEPTRPLNEHEKAYLADLLTLDFEMNTLRKRVAAQRPAAFPTVWLWLAAAVAAPFVAAFVGAGL